MRVRCETLKLAGFVFVALAVAGSGRLSAGTEPLTFRDLMEFRQIRGAAISERGDWIAYGLVPDRGEGEAVARSVDGETEFRVERGGSPRISADSRWLAAVIVPTQQQRDEAAEKKAAGKAATKDDGPRNGLALVSLADGEETRFEEVESFAFSDDGRWIARKHYKQEKPVEPSGGEEGEDEKADAKKSDKDRHVGTTLVLRDLSDGRDVTFEHVTAYAFDEPSRHLAYAVATPDGVGNGLFVRNLAAGTSEPLAAAEDARYTHLAWAEESSRLAFLAAVDDDLFKPGPADLYTWDGDRGGAASLRAADANAPDGWRIPSKNKVAWSKDGDRLFFGYARIDPEVEKLRARVDDEKRKKRALEAMDEEQRERAKAEEAASFDPYDVEALLEDRGLDVWHGDDPLIVPNQKVRWKETEKDRVHLAVLHRDSGRVVRLAKEDLPEVLPSDNPRAVLAWSDLDYLRRITWDGRYADLYHVDLKTGERKPIVEELPVASGERFGSQTARLSPGGRYVVYWRDPHWMLFDADDGSTRNLTAGLDVPFADEDDDYPQSDPGYGIADWIEGDRAVLIYDKYDVWRFPAAGGKPVNLTAGKGRDETRRFRVIDLDPERDHLQSGERLLLHGYHDRLKNDGFWETRADRAKLKRLIEEPKKFRFVAKAKEADRLLYTREAYDEFPDLRVAGLDLAGGRRLSDVNPQIERFAWGRAELIEWASADGVPLQGVLIRPGNEEPGKRYPVLVYFYRFFSQRLHEFNEPVVNHRPSFPIYASNGYAVFLPDVRFEVGRPGLSAVKALVPGVQKLVEMGVADPAAVGLHGHSWSGYQAAYVVTQTDLFAAAVAGAPVSNMTSAYSGIRLGSGLARQFQYEQSQSRIGASLDAAWPLYVENSPVFYARRIDTPLLIQFGDRDEAVPWQQGIELYLAMRRLDKDVIFLQYRGEPHHLKRYPNKLDYSIKMKEFFDHHLKGAEAPAWIRDGVPYRGD